MAEPITYSQEINWHEDSRGLISCRINISDKYEGLFSATPTEMNILVINEVSKSVQNTSGGIEKKELTLTLDETVCRETNDVAAKNFILDAQDETVKRFVAIFIDTATTPLPADMLYSGLINDEIEADDIIWHGNHFETTPVPLRKFKIKTQTYDDKVFNDITIEQLIAGIDTTWETNNVKNRAGYYYTSTNDSRVMVYQLVNLNNLLRKLADVEETLITSSGYGDINIQFDACEIDGKWLPARWNHWYYDGVDSRYVQSPYKYHKPAFTCYEADAQSLILDPDNEPATIAYDSHGVPSNAASIAYAESSIWISYGFVKALGEEPSPDIAKSYRITQYKSLFGLINAIAKNFGLFVKIYWEDTTTLRIKFISRSSLTQETIFIKSANKASIKPTGNSIENIAVESGKACYYAAEGADCYVKDNSSGDTIWYSSELFKTLDTANSLMLTISPTIADIIVAMIYKYQVDEVYLPHNHTHWTGQILLEKSWNELAGFHSAIYLFAAKNTSHTDSANEPAYYFTPAAKMMVSIDGEVKQYDKLADYLNYISGYDKAFLMYEYNLEIPWWYGASLNANGTSPDWKYFDLFNKFSMDNANWAIVGLKWSFSGRNISLTAHSFARFIYTTGTDTPVTPDYAIVAERLAGNITGIISGIAYETIGELDIVSLKSDGTYEKSVPINTHWNRIAGVSIKETDTGEYVTVQKKGELYNVNLPDEALNTQIYLRKATGSNISISPLTAKTAEEDMVVIIGKYIDTQRIYLYDKFIEMIYE